MQKPTVYPPNEEQLAVSLLQKLSERQIENLILLLRPVTVEEPTVTDIPAKKSK